MFREVSNFLHQRAANLASLASKDLSFLADAHPFLRSSVRPSVDGSFLVYDQDPNFSGSSLSDSCSFPAEKEVHPALLLPEVDESKLTAKFVISTLSKDRMGDIVLPRGCLPLLQKNYRRNPRVFFSHNTKDLPIGSARHPDGSVAVEVFDTYLASMVYFHGKTVESEIIFHLVASGELQAASIGFLPVRAAMLKVSKVEERPEENEFGEPIIYFQDGNPYFPCLRFHEWDLTEWSIVPVPANADCISMHLSRGKILGLPIPETLQQAFQPFAFTPKFHSISVPKGNSMEKKEPLDALLPPPLPNPNTASAPAPNPDSDVKPELEVKLCPFGAKFLKSSMDRIDSWRAYIDECCKELDHPRVKRYAEKQADKLIKTKAKIVQLGCQLYPDLFDAKALGFSEVSESSTTKALVEEADPGVDPGVDWSEVATALQSYEDRQAQVEELFFSLTGQRI